MFAKCTTFMMLFIWPHNSIATGILAQPINLRENVETKSSEIQVVLS